MRLQRCGREWGVGLVFLVLALGWAWPAGAAPGLDSPRPSDRQISRVVSALMRQHLSQHAIDDEMSVRALEQFLKTLDRMKLYFLQSDIDEFNKQRDQLDDQITKGDISFAYTVFKRLLQRIDEKVVLVDELLAEKLDFTADEQLELDPDKLAFAKDSVEARNRWRQRLKYELLVLKNDKAAKNEDPVERLRRRYHSFAKRMHRTDGDKLLELFLTSLTTSFDPHTTYMSPSSLNSFRILMSLNLEGIGAQLQLIDGHTVITKVIPGGAAEKSGQIKIEDQIVSVGQGDTGEMVDVVDMNLDDVVALIRGRAGTVVRLGVIPGGGGNTKIARIVRAKVELKDQEARSVIFEEGKKPDGSPYQVGVIDLPSFYMDMEAERGKDADFKSTTRDVKKLLDEFKTKGVDVVVLDLRRNGGGALKEAINLTGLFIDTGPVVQVKEPDGRVHQFHDLDRGMYWKGPLVVVTSKLSASASEILAGAIQDYGRGLVIGDTATHGKGTVQSLLDLGPELFRINDPPNLGALKLTMQQFYRPNGDSTQLRGVLADVVLPSFTDHMENVAESDEDHAMAFDKVPSSEFNRYNLVNQPLVARLKELSAARRQKSSDFAKLQRDIERYVEQKKNKQVPLNEQKFLARRAEFDADAEDEKTIEAQSNGKEEVVERNFYFNEVLGVTIDYLQGLGKEPVAATR